MDPMTFRSLERILAVAIGGLSIVLGYRLFLALPQQRDSTGSIRLPWNISIALSRVGPGVFFALFGAAVVGVSLYAAVRIDQPPGGRVTSYLGVDPAASENQQSLRFRRLDTRTLMEDLNAIPALLRRDLSEEQKRAVARSLTAVKLTLMEPLWDPDWGDRSAFRDWAEGDAADPVPAGLDKSATFFRARSGDAK